MNIDVHIRWMIRADLEDVLEIENLCFPKPWDKDDFRRCLDSRSCVGMVAEFQQRVVGYFIYTLNDTHLGLINIAVLPSLHGRGIGRQMIRKLLGTLGTRRTLLRAHVADFNLDAQLFFKALGFRCVKTEKECWANVDAYVFEMNRVAVPEIAGCVISY